MDWRRWHDEYDEPGSRLSRRLEVVRARLWNVLDEVDCAEPRLLSLCGGDARDVVPVLGQHPKGRSARALVVELDEVLANRAGESVRAAGLQHFDVRCADAGDSARDEGLVGVEVRCADAGDPASFVDFVPTDVLLLCGIFGNVESEGVRDMIRRVSSMVTHGGYVIWTRGAGDGDDDPREDVRRWFVEAGMPELSFDGPPEAYGVGVNLVPHKAQRPLGTSPLFTFVW